MKFSTQVIFITQTWTVHTSIIIITPSFQFTHIYNIHDTAYIIWPDDLHHR